MEDKKFALSKYTGIAKARQTVFFAVAGASVVTAFAGVSIYFIAQNIIFNSKVLSEQGKSIETIKSSHKNITNPDNGVEKKAKELQASLDAREGLRDLIPGNEGSSLRLIVDALPAEPNTAAVGSSLNQHILSGLPIKIESIRVEPVSSEKANQKTVELTSAQKRQLERDPNKEDKVSRNLKPINFTFAVSAENNGDKDPNVNVLNEVLKRMEKSIRTFRIDNYKFEYTKKNATLTISGQAFYLPKYDLSLKNKEIKSDEKSAKKQSTGVKK